MSNSLIGVSKGLSKTIASLTSIATVLSLSGFAALAPMSAIAASPSDYGLTEGNTISAAGSNDPDIYIVNQPGYKRLFLNPVIFSFYGHLGGFPNVKNVTATTRDAFPTSGLFRNCETNDQQVWAVEVNGEDTGVFHKVVMSGDTAVAQDPNFFAKVFCINNNESAWYAKSSVDYTNLSQVPVYSRVPGSTPTPTYGPLSVGISSDNPASNTLIAGQASADLAHFTFTGSGTVTSVVLNRLGVSSDTTLANLYLYNGTKRLTDAATVSSGKITFSDTAGLFVVNGSMNISVKSDIAASTSGQTVGVQLASWNVNTVSLSGNLMTIATAPSDFATVAVGAPTPAGTSADVTLDPQKDYNMWQSSITVGNHDVWLKSLQLRVIGSVVIGDLQNFRLYVDGVLAGSAVALQDANGYLVFDLGSGVKLLAGTRQIKLLGDVLGGSNKKFTISLRQKPDIAVVDTQYGQAVLATGTFPASAPNATYEQSINVGTITITKATDSPSGDVVATATGVKLVSYKFEAFGEPLKFETLRASFTATDGTSAITDMMSLRNAAIYADGVQIGSLASLCEDSVSTTASCSAGTAYTEYSLGSSLVVTPGTPRIVDIRADIYDNTGTQDAVANNTITAQIILGSSNVQRVKSLGYFSQAAPAVGSTLTIKTGSFTASKYTGYANQSIVTPQTQYKFGSYNLTAATSEDVNVSAINLDVSDQNNSGAFQAADMTNVFLKIYNDAGSLVSSTTPKSTISGTASNSYSVNFTIPQTKVWRVDAYADIGSSTGTATMVSNLGASGLTAASSTTATAADAAGQSITSATGSLVLNNGSIPANKVINGGQTANVYSFTLNPQYDNFTLDDAVFKLSSTLASSSNAVGTAYLKENGVVVGSANIGNPGVSNSLSFLGVNRPISLSGGSKTYTVDVAFSNIGPSYGTDTGGLVLVQLSHLKYRNNAGTITTSTVSPSTYQGNSNYVVAGYPTFTNAGLPSAVLAAGTQTLFKTNVTANGGAITWRKVVFTVTATANPTIAGSGWQLFENGVDITSTASTSALSGYGYATASHDFNVAAAGTGTVAFTFASERTINAGTSSTLELKGVLGGTLSAGHSVTTKIANPSASTFATANEATVFSPHDGWGSDVNPSFLWSDSSAPSHNTDGTTSDWMGDGLLTGLNSSQALTQ